MNRNGIYGHDRQLKKLNILVDRKTIPNSLLFAGPSGIGKRTIAMRVIASLYCMENNAPCMECTSCRTVSSGTYPDFIEIKKNEKGKIQIGDKDKPEEGTLRWLIGKLSNKASLSSHGVIIDGVDSISETGQNALLKTIEEPPLGTVIILLCESKNRVLPTILSRSLYLNFNPLSNEDLISILEKNLTISSINSLIPKISGGSVEIALRLNEEELLSNIVEYCNYISESVESNSILGEPPDLIKGVSSEFLLTVLINLYSVMLSDCINRKQGFSEEIRIPEISKIKKIMKILLAMKRGLDNNLNFKINLKGMLYSFDQVKDNALVKPDFSWIK